MKVGGRKLGGDWVTGQFTRLCTFVRVLFQRFVNLGAQKQRTGLAYGKDKLFTKKVPCLGHDYTSRPFQLGIYDQVTLEVTFHRSPHASTAPTRNHNFVCTRLEAASPAPPRSTKACGHGLCLHTQDDCYEQGGFRISTSESLGVHGRVNSLGLYLRVLIPSS